MMRQDKAKNWSAIIKSHKLLAFVTFILWEKKSERTFTEKKLEKLLFAQAASIEFIRLSEDKKLGGMDGRTMKKLLTDSPG